LREALSTAGYSKIALTIMAANANPATTPAAMAADIKMNSPIVIHLTAGRRQDFGAPNIDCCRLCRSQMIAARVDNGK
jgi:hypothetical protein